MSFGDYWENKVLDHLLGATVYTAPATVYVGLSTTDPLDDGSGVTEPSGANGYSRVAVTNNPANFPAALAGIKKNGVLLTFPQNTTADWGLLPYVFITDSALGGNMLASGLISPPKTIQTGDVAEFAINSLIFTLN